MEKQCVLWTNHNNNYLQIILKNFVAFMLNLTFYWWVSVIHSMAILQHTWQCSCDSVSTFHFGPLVRHPPRSHQGVKSHCRRGLHHLVALYWSVHLQEHLCWHHGLVHMCGLDFLSLTKLCAFIMEMNTKWHEISVLLPLIIQGTKLRLIQSPMRLKLLSCWRPRFKS